MGSVSGHIGLDTERQHVRVRSCALMLAVVFAGICVLVLLFQMFSGGGQGFNSLDSKINPNTASLDSLVRLPGIGASKAGAIIEYRDSNGGGNVFKNIGDLEKVKGIGTKTVEKISDYLYFGEDGEQADVVRE